MQEKLGWINDYRDDIIRWNACQEVVSTTLTFINKQGVSHGTARRLCDEFRDLQSRNTRTNNPVSRDMAAKLVWFVRDAESKLNVGERVPLSTEIEESLFCLFKQIEGQHNKGGLTSLVAGIGCLLKPTTPESIRQALTQVPIKKLRAWTNETEKKPHRQTPNRLPRIP